MYFDKWSNHVQFVVLISVLLGGFYLLDNKIQRQSERQSLRTDRLYEMFIDLVKENRK